MRLGGCCPRGSSPAQLTPTLALSLLGEGAIALDLLDGAVLAPVGPHRQEVRIEGPVDANLLGAPVLLLLGTGLVVAHGWGLRATAQGIGDELGEALLGVQAAEVKDVLHEEGHHTCFVHCLCVRPEVQPLTTSWHDLVLGDLVASTRDVLDADQELLLHLWDDDGEVDPPGARELRPQAGHCQPAATLDMPLPEHLGEDRLLMSRGGDRCAARDHVAGIEELPDGSPAAAYLVLAVCVACLAFSSSASIM